MTGTMLRNTFNITGLVYEKRCNLCGKIVQVPEVCGYTLCSECYRKLEPVIGYQLGMVGLPRIIVRCNERSEKNEGLSN